MVAMKGDIGTSTAPSLALEERYQRALTAYVDRIDHKTRLVAVLELGRMILAEGRSLLDLLSLHYASLISLLAEFKRTASPVTC
jgi:hypothetical protein